jgi:hypothetical protein
MFQVERMASAKALWQQQTCILMRQKEDRYRKQFKRCNRDEAGKVSRGQAMSGCPGQRMNLALDRNCSASHWRDLSREW